MRALSEQRAVIDSLRTRAGLLLSSAAVTTSFLGGQAIHGSRVGVLAWLGLLDFAAVAALVIATLRPRAFEFSTHPGEIAHRTATAGGMPSATALYEALTARLHGGLARNRIVLGRLAALLQLAGSLLALEVVLWIVAIALIP
ncbi:MAG: hypothetical protein AB7V58_13505 [Solirubrobacterales bacterium]